MKAAARARGLSWNLADGDVFRLMTGDCHWCDAPPANVKQLERRAVRAPFPYSGIDRVDNERGYEPDNVVSCCGPCNWMKRHLPVHQFLAHVGRIARKWGSL